MRRDVQEIFRNTPHGKQVMMFSATLSKDIRPVCKKFMQDVIELLFIQTYCSHTTTTTTTAKSYRTCGANWTNVTCAMVNWFTPKHAIPGSVLKAPSTSNI